MNETNKKKISEKGVKWGLTAILAILIWGIFIFGYKVLPSDVSIIVAIVAWIFFIYFGWKFTFSMKLFAAGTLFNPKASGFGERLHYGLLATLIGFVVKFILSMLIGFFVTPYMLGKMLAPKVTAWLNRREDLKGL